MVAREARSKDPQKLSARWEGPYIVTDVPSMWKLLYCDIGNSKQVNEIHTSLVKPFVRAEVARDFSPEEIRSYKKFQQFVSERYRFVQSLLDLRESFDNGLMILVKWEDGTETWEPFTLIAEDVPAKAREFCAVRKIDFDEIASIHRDTAGK